MFAKLFAAVVATCLSSFTNLCAYRIGRSQSPWSPPRSYCPSCHRPLCWWQLVPILGFIIQGGHCHFCHHRIPAYDPACELLCGSFAYVLASPSLFHSLLVIIVIQALLFIASCDYYYQCLYPVSLSGLFSLFLIIPHPALSTIVVLAIVILLIILTFMAVQLQWLGGGDVLFIAILLLAFGPGTAAAIILCACLITLPCFFFQQQKQLPFLPALCLATLVGLTFICA